MNRVSWRYRGMVLRFRFSMRYLKRWRETPPIERLRLPAPNRFKQPICWLRGHVFPGQVFEVTPWQLQFCTCCSEEVAGRTRWDDISPRPVGFLDWQCEYKEHTHEH